MKTPRKKYDDSELFRVSDYLSHEVKMFLALSKLKLTGPEGSQPIINACLDSFIIHFRVLCEFFYPEGRVKQGIVLAKHFFNSPLDWKCPKISSPLRDSRDRAHKELAHLKYDRLKVAPDEKSWKPAKVRKELMPVILEFFKAVPDARIGPKCSALKEQLLASQGAPMPRQGRARRFVLVAESSGL